MIKISPSPSSASREENDLLSRAKDEDLKARHGVILNGSEKLSSVVIDNKYVVSFSKTTPTMGAYIKSQGMTLQKWGKEEIRWRNLALSRQLALHP